MARHVRQVYCRDEGISDDNKRYLPDHLPLGRIATKDFSNDRTLDRLMLYERRIENSMLRMLREFKKQQIMKQIIQQDTGRQSEPSPSLRDEAATRSNAGKNIDLKKQSQFMPDLMGVTPFMKSDYDNISAAEIEENKANPPGLSMPTRNLRTSQSQFHAPLLPERLLKTKNRLQQLLVSRMC